ncbi:hypothetical protein MJ579_08920 [Klebsiella pneumoniae]|nr:hypothetical protein MJ579_08920 [Klebsiella pneumoniae]
MISSPKRRRKPNWLFRQYQSERSAGGDDRRRHQRRARAGSGRRGGSHELRTQAAKEAGNMVDGFQPHQADWWSISANRC